MSNLASEEFQKYTDMWAVPDYDVRSPGEQLVPVFLDMIQTSKRGHVLDAGCGAGKGALALQREGFKVSMCDITDAGLTEEAKSIPFEQVCLWKSPRIVLVHDWVYCCDVLEHIPTQHTMLVVSNLLKQAHKGLFLSIALQPDNMGVWVGTPLHQTVQPFTWWRDNLATLATVVEARDFMSTGIYLLKPCYD